MTDPPYVSDVPRTQAQIARDGFIKGAPGIVQGGQQARPVRTDQQAARQQTLAPAYERLSATESVAISGTSGAANVTNWTFVADNNGGNSLRFGDGTNGSLGGVYFLNEGIYAVTITLYPAIFSGSASCMVLAETSSAELTNPPSVAWHGDQYRSGYVPFTTASMTGYSPGRGYSYGLFTDIYYANVPGGTTTIGVAIDVARVR